MCSTLRVRTYIIVLSLTNLPQEFSDLFLFNFFVATSTVKTQYTAQEHDGNYNNVRNLLHFLLL